MVGQENQIVRNCPVRKGLAGRAAAVKGNAGKEERKGTDNQEKQGIADALSRVQSSNSKDKPVLSS